MNEINTSKEIRAAIKQGDAHKVKKLIEQNNGAIDLITPFGTWLHVASSRGQLEIVQLLVSLGADVNRRAGVFDGTALNEAANEGHLSIVEFLLACNGIMDTSEPERNPLFSAIISGNQEIVKRLLDSGIDASVRYSGKNMDGMDAYDFAIERGQIDIAKMLKPYRK